VHPRSPSTLAHPRPSDRTRGHCRYAPHFGRPGQASRTSPPDPRRQNRAILRNPPPHAGRCSPAASPAPRGRRQNPGALPLCPPLRSHPAGPRGQPNPPPGFRTRRSCANHRPHAGRRSPSTPARPGPATEPGGIAAMSPTSVAPAGRGGVRRVRGAGARPGERSGLRGRAGCAGWGSQTPRRRALPGRITRDRGNRRRRRNWGARRTTR
jgi:hypothetical protein